jgi:uncharacterized protein RhaS with RHS repeats
VTAVVGTEGERTEFTYDGANRRTEVRTIVPGGDDIVLQYQYDGAGNITGITRPDGSRWR